MRVRHHTMAAVRRQRAMPSCNGSQPASASCAAVTTTSGRSPAFLNDRACASDVYNSANSSRRLRYNRGDAWCRRWMSRLHQAMIEWHLPWQFTAPSADGPAARGRCLSVPCESLNVDETLHLIQISTSR
jgi:hypothetical protein